VTVPRDHTTSGDSSTPIPAIEVSGALLQAAAHDSEYRDLYLRRALQLIVPMMPPERVHGAAEDERRTRALHTQTEHAILLDDWERAGALARELEGLERARDALAPLVAAATRLYAAIEAPPGPQAISVASFGGGTLAALGASIEGATSALSSLEHCDPALSRLYAERRKALTARSSTTHPYDHVPAATLRGEALRALRAGQWAMLRGIASRVVSASPLGRASADCQCGDLPAPEPLPDTLIETGVRATEMGLTDVTVEGRPDLFTYLACRCAAAPTLSDVDLSPEHRAPTRSSCRRAREYGDLASRLRENLDLLKHRVFLTSLGTRYLPSFQRERVLVESFPDTEIPDGPLIDRLGLPRRGDLARRDVERCLIASGDRVLGDLGLDPLEFVLTLVPFDVYLRLAPRFQWGTRDAWTHLDGYQVLRGWHLRALVGGHRRYGGEQDLCSVGPTHEYTGVLTRFAVLRRQRLRRSLGAAVDTATRPTHGSRGPHP